MRTIGLFVLSSSMVLQGPTRSTDVEVPGLGMKLKAGWRLLMENGCRYSVPLTWRLTTGGTVATAPDGSTLTIATIQSASWPRYRAQMRRALDRGVVHEDSNVRFWIEIDDEIRHEHHIAAGGGAVTCVGVLELRDAALGEELARVIAESIGPAPAKWPPSSK
jgi:hypothetical protein